MTDSRPAVIVYGLPGIGDVSSVSPFVLKVETWLRLAGVPYVSKVGDVRRAPRGKAPWITLDGEVIADSEQIIDRLGGRFGDPLGDASLDASERARGHLLRRTLEEGLYWIMVYERWSSDRHFARINAMFRKLLPAPLRPIVPKIIRRRVLGTMARHGVARYSAAERQVTAAGDLDAVASVLGDGVWLFGDRPTRYDAVLYAFLAQILYTPFDGPLQDHARANPKLVAYADRIRDRCWGTPGEAALAAA